MKKLLLFGMCLWMGLSAVAQTYSYSDIAQQYPLSSDNGKKVVSGFIPLSGKTDQTIFANALLWTIDQISPKMREGIRNINFNRLSFECNYVLQSDEEGKSKNTYYFKGEWRVNEGKLVYYLSDILVESPSLLMKKVTAIDKLQPEKKESHKLTVDDFIKTESYILNQMFDFVTNHKLQKITYWEEIKIAKPTKGMNEDECRLAFGKPQTILVNDQETQWMYSSSFYLFFKNGKVNTIIK